MTDQPEPLSEGDLRLWRWPNGQGSYHLDELGDMHPTIEAELVATIDALREEVEAERRDSLYWEENCMEARRDRVEARAEVGRLTEANHSVSVCADHTEEIQGDGCYVCDNARLRSLLEKHREALRPIVYGQWDELGEDEEGRYYLEIPSELFDAARAALALPGEEKLP